MRIDFDDRAISPIIGIVLVFGMTIAGSAAVLYVGSPALENMQGEADVSKVEIGMVQIASRVETVGMSDERMSVALAQSKGQYYVDETAGHITIRHLDYDGEGETQTSIRPILGPSFTSLTKQRLPIRAAVSGGSTRAEAQ
ncbi:DUF7289 family protein [Haladaptatus sp. GCM10025893]|uniref:DUF7289 family protein n=1 Tax=Haladaptatus sp. GCM10025893 TaxID=3252659 RepID=UPI003620D12A